MHIIINYNSEDYNADLLKTSKIKNKISNKGIYAYRLLFALITIVIIITGIQANNAQYYFSGSVYLGIGIAICISWILLILVEILRKKAIRITAKTDALSGTERTYSFTEDLVTYRTSKVYIEYNWEYFSAYLITEGFIFFVAGKLDDAIFLSMSQLYEQQFHELNNFVASKLPLYKPYKSSKSS